MKKIAALAAAVALAGATIAIAPSASAGHTRNVYMCNSAGQIRDTSVTANPGDTIRVFYLHCPDFGWASAAASNASVWSLPQWTRIWPSGSASGTVLALGTSTQKFGVNGIGYDLATLTVNSVSEPVPPPPPFEPHDYLQQVALPSSGSCADVPESAGHWHGSPSGGWSKSWAWWPNGGLGGHVCTREVETTESGALILVG